MHVQQSVSMYVCMYVCFTFLACVVALHWKRHSEWSPYPSPQDCSAEEFRFLLTSTAALQYMMYISATSNTLAQTSPIAGLLSSANTCYNHEALVCRSVSPKNNVTIILYMRVVSYAPALV